MHDAGPAEVIARLRAAGCVFAEDEARLLAAAAADDAALDVLVDRRTSGVPLEHILGWAEFAGLRIEVADGVFVPRRRTEFLARQAIELARTITGRAPVVLDLCCGSGAIAALVAADLDEVQLVAAELDPTAVRCARRNLPPGCPVYEGDLYDPLPATLHHAIDVLVANVPYVPTDAVALMPPEARDHEARFALDGGADGLDVARRVVAGAQHWLVQGGHLLIETGEEQAPLAVDVFERGGLIARVAQSAELYATVVIGAPGR